MYIYTHQDPSMVSMLPYVDVFLVSHMYIQTDTQIDKHTYKYAPLQPPPELGVVMYGLASIGSY